MFSASTPPNKRLDVRLSTFFRNPSPWVQRLYPPVWSVAKRVVDNATLYRYVRLWAVICPFIVGLLSVFPVTIEARGIAVTLDTLPQIPFSFILSFIGAVCLLVAILIYRLASPALIREFEPVFTSLPDRLPLDGLIERVRKTLIERLPVRITAGDVTYVKGSGEGYRPEDMGELGLNNRALYEAIGDVYWQSSGLLQRRLAIGVLPLSPMEEHSQLSVLVHKSQTENDRPELYPGSIPYLYIRGEPRVAEKNGPALFRIYYEALDHCDTALRGAMWALFAIGSACSALVVVQIVIKGFFGILAVV